MGKRRELIILSLTFLTLWCSAQKRPDDERLRDLIRAMGQADVIIPHPGAAELQSLSRNISIRSVRDRKVFLVLSQSNVDWFIASGYDYLISEPPSGKNVLNSETMKQAMEWESYPTLEQYDSIMQYFAEEHPSLCRLDTIGESIRGRIIYVLKISADAGTDKDLPRVFYSSTMHGDEIGGFVLMLRLANHLLKSYQSDARIKTLLDNIEIWINPLANPDGTYFFSDEITSPVRDNANGYDLNRNFPDPFTPNTVKQKETLDMIRFMQKHRFALSANFHSGAEVVNYPWDRWERHHADNDWFYEISRKYADTVHYYSSPGYMDDLDNGITNGYQWYQIYGGRQDFVTYELQGREVTIELDNSYITPADKLSDLWEYNRQSLVGYLENALYGIHGRTEDAVTGMPVPARLFIEGHDRDKSHVFSDTLSGRFNRLISPGLWDITFSAEGYRDTTVKEIMVSGNVKTIILLKMKKNLNPVDTTDRSVPLLYPNPGTSFIKAVLPGKLTGRINIKIFSQSGMKMSDYDTETAGTNTVVMDINSLAAGSYIVVFTSRITNSSMTGRFVKPGHF